MLYSAARRADVAAVVRPYGRTERVRTVPAVGMASSTARPRLSLTTRLSPEQPVTHIAVVNVKESLPKGLILPSELCLIIQENNRHITKLEKATIRIIL